MGGRLGVVCFVVGNCGMVVELCDLFFVIFVWLKFLCSDRVEMQVIVEVICCLVMVEFYVGFSLMDEDEGCVLFCVDVEQGDLFGVLQMWLVWVMGCDFIDNVLVIDVSCDEISLIGFVVLLIYLCGVVVVQYLFVNGCLVCDKLLIGVMWVGYMDVLVQGWYLVVVLFVICDLYLVDVNVYFVKVEVCFCEFDVVCGLVVLVLWYVLVGVGYWLFSIVVMVVLQVVQVELQCLLYQVFVCFLGVVIVVSFGFQVLGFFEVFSVCVELEFEIDVIEVLFGVVWV